MISPFKILYNLNNLAIIFFLLFSMNLGTKFVFQPTFWHFTEIWNFWVDFFFQHWFFIHWRSYSFSKIYSFEELYIVFMKQYTMLINYNFKLLYILIECIVISRLLKVRCSLATALFTREYCWGERQLEFRYFPPCMETQKHLAWKLHFGFENCQSEISIYIIMNIWK